MTQTNQHRVLRIRDPLSASALVDVVLGQTDLTNTYCNRNPNDPANGNAWAAPDLSFVKLNTLCYPGALAIDKKGNLYVSDHYHEIAGNQRLLLFSSATFPDAPASVVFAPDAAKEFPRSQGFGTWEPAFDSTNRMVVGYNPYSAKTGKFVEYFNDPTCPSVTTPSGKLNDYYGWAEAATFDTSNNLYVFDDNRGKVLIYKTPFANAPPTVCITSPADGSVVSRNTKVIIAANASDYQGVRKVEFLVNNSLTCTDKVAPYTCTWKVPPIAGVSYALTAKAYDAVGNTATATVRVTSSR